MANYFLQPDSNSICCDCATRVSPCDDCATTGCPLYGLNVSDVIGGSGADCDEAIANLPPYSGNFSIDGGPSPDPYGGIPSASFKQDFPGNCIIYRSRQKITFDPMPIACKVCWLVRTFDLDSNLLDEFVMSEDLAIGATETSVYEFLEPSANGATFMLYPIAICCTGSSCCLEFGLPGGGSCGNPVGYCPSGTFAGTSSDPIPCSCSPNPC